MSIAKIIGMIIGLALVVFIGYLRSNAKKYGDKADNKEEKQS